MKKIEHVDGNNKGKIMLYALSTCSWCKKTKEFLDKLGVAYSYIYVDLLEGDDKSETIDEVKHWNSRCTFPTLLINNENSIVGFKEGKIKEALKI